LKEITDRNGLVINYTMLLRTAYPPPPPPWPITP